MGSEEKRDEKLEEFDVSSPDIHQNYKWKSFDVK
jgi:hypothetical protein